MNVNVNLWFRLRLRLKVAVKAKAEATGRQQYAICFHLSRQVTNSTKLNKLGNLFYSYIHKNISSDIILNFNFNFKNR
jgi:hypothetical protein